MTKAIEQLRSGLTVGHAGLELHGKLARRLLLARAASRCTTVVVWLGLVAAINLVVHQPALAQVVLSSQLGNSLDPLTGAFPLFVAPGETRFSALSIGNNPSNLRQVTANVQIGVRCCTDTVTGNSVAPAGLSLRVTPSMCRDAPLTLGPQATPMLPPTGGPREVALPICPSLSDPTVSITPTTGGSAFLRLTADANAAPTLPGGLTATVVARWTEGGQPVEATLGVRLSVVPRDWPGDGPVSPCAPGLTVLPLGSIAPMPFDMKRANLSKTSLTIGAAFDQTSPAAGGGLEFTIGASPTNLIAPGSTTVSFKNTKGWPVGMRTVDSRNCAAQGQSVVVPEGQTRTLAFSANNATTLVFSKSTCRAWVDLFDCWGQSALGLDDVVVLSEGPFWLLFGNHKVDLLSVGDWGAMSRPNAVLIIRTP